MNKWAKNTVFYQIYPTSFYDSNGDGIGDLRGIIEKKEYIKSLGVGAIWLNPINLSPFMDGGYDVKDYYKVDPRFGTMEDLKNLIKEFHESGIRVLLDLVIGHTSYEHEWFINSAKDERNEYSDYYIWTDSNFSKYKDKTIHGLFPRDGGYYVNYYACQPALNFGFNKVESNNAKSIYEAGESWKYLYNDERLVPLRNEIIKIMEFYIEMGCDGFRIDMANSLVKGCRFDSENVEDIEGLIYLWNKLMTPIRKKYPDVIFVSEWINAVNSVKHCKFDVDFYAHDIECYNSLFRNESGSNLLPGLEKGHSYFKEEGLGENESFFERYLNDLKEIEGIGYVSIPDGSHDQVRIATYKSDEEMKCVFAFLMTLKHVPFVYYGDEIGIRHTFGINKDGGYIRTGARTPMQWDASKNRGFSSSDNPYLNTNDSISECVSVQENDENSLLNVFRKLVQIRNSHEALNADSEFKLIKDGYPTIYERKSEEEKLVVIINPSNRDYVEKISYESAIYSYNVEFVNDELKLNGISFAILKR